MSHQTKSNVTFPFFVIPSKDCDGRESSKGKVRRACGRGRYHDNANKKQGDHCPLASLALR